MWKNYELEILYQDEHYVAINKPSGLLVHKSMIDKDEIYFAMQMLRDQLGMYVYPLHRLDKPTSGVLLFALSSEAARVMSELFSVHAMEKRYIAIVRGYLEEEGIIEHALSHKHDKMTDAKAKEDKEPQEAMTHYKSLARVELPHAIGKYAQTRYSLVELTPKTGRKHQLRRHMKHISHHILGDTKYGRGEHNSFVRQQYSCNRLMLHAMTLEVMHPYTKEKLEIVAPLDTTFIKMFEIFGWSY
jgi:tRNA pseudouridine65 synthase